MSSTVAIDEPITGAHCSSCSLPLPPFGRDGGLLTCEPQLDRSPGCGAYTIFRPRPAGGFYQDLVCHGPPWQVWPFPIPRDSVPDTP